MAVTADDLQQALDLTAATLGQAHDADWQAKAGDLEWTCWETVEHLADDMFAYAGQVAVSSPARYVPFLTAKRRRGGPRNGIFAEPDGGVTGLLEVLAASGGLLVATVRTASPEHRSYHGWGLSDPEGFTAMGIVEALVHLHDLSQGLGLHWDPPTDLCRAVLVRLFPHAPADTDPWQTLLWATGRTALPNHERLSKWRWYAAPR